MSVPVVVGAGWFFWDHLSRAQRGVRIVEVSLAVAIAGVVGVARLVRRRRARSPAVGDAGGPGSR